MCYNDFSVVNFFTYLPHRSSFLDQEWFTFETAGTLVVGWHGGPARQRTQDGHRPTGGAQNKGDNKQLGIEIAAAAATGQFELCCLHVRSYLESEKFLCLSRLTLNALNLLFLCCLNLTQYFRQTCAHTVLV